MNTVRKFNYTAIAALLLASSAFAAPARQSRSVAAEGPGWNFQKEASDTLRDVQVLTAKLSLDAERLESFSRSQLSWQSHAHQLSLVREHVNQIGERLERLQEIRHLTSPWQQQAIDGIVPVAVELATGTEAAIGHLNKDKGHLFAPAYADHLSTISDRADEVKESVNTFLEFAETQQKLDQLQEKISDLRS